MKRTITFLTTILVTACLTIVWGPSHWAGASTTSAANKISIAADDAQIMNQNQQPNNNSTQDYTLFSTTFNTSTTEDLLMTVNAECGLYTAVGGKGAGSTSSSTVTTSSTAVGSVVIWLELDNKPLPTTNKDAFSYGDPNAVDSSGNPAPKTGNGPVDYCNRAFNLSTGGLTASQFITIYDNTRDANSFTWFALNVGNGSHTLVAKARLIANTASSGTVGGTGSCDTTTGCPYTVPAASAIVGQRTLVVEPDHLANSASF